MQFLMSTCNPILNKPKPKPKEEPPKEEKTTDATSNDAGDQSAGNGEVKDTTEVKDAAANPATAKDKESKAEMELD